ncbi:MAG: cytochrome c biogenesis protein CcsA, partial [Planctomycetota bacterium]
MIRSIFLLLALAWPVSANDLFLSQLQLDQLGTVAAFDQGRVKSLDSLAASVMKRITGARKPTGTTNLTEMLDLALRPEAWTNRPTIYVKNKLVRAELAAAMAKAGGPQEDQDNLTETGLVAQRHLETPEATATLDRLSRDLMRTARPVEEIRGALSWARPKVLRSLFTVVAPPDGGFESRWFTLDELNMGGMTAPIFSGIDSEVRRKSIGHWQALTDAWSAGDANTVNGSAAALAALLPQVNPDPEIYPSSARLSWESWYFRNGNLTLFWLAYGFALAPLLMAVVFQWRGAMKVGLAMFLVAVLLHTFSVGLRWWVSGRWPNSNMFEAVTTAAWFGAFFALAFEMFLPRSPVRGIVALGGAGTGMVALMCAHFMPLSLDPTISNMMPVLHDVWLYIHTNVIIFSYALIFMASVTAGIYLLWRGSLRLRGQSQGAILHAGGGGTSMMLAGRARSLGEVMDGATMILVELSFILLWAGIVMGAIWADHSWGRPWGWDPKEVFALNTFLVFAVLVHVR